MSSDVEFLHGLTIGTVESVAPERFVVALTTDAPQTTALNTGVPTPFPRLNSFVLIPGQGASIVGQVSWLGVERSPFPKRPGLKDFGLIDLPYPHRKMHLTPLGMLYSEGGEEGGEVGYRLERGVTGFPSVGDNVILPLKEQTRAIVQSSGPDSRVPIGHSPILSDALISIDPNKLFGRHAAVLGNTGSGKSCTVAGLIRWSIEEALTAGEEGVNARFIVLDPNGEYDHAFQDLADEIRVFRVEPDLPDDNLGRPLQVPAWMWNLEEWSAFTSASAKVQQPILMQALRELRAGGGQAVSLEDHIVGMVNAYRISIEHYRSSVGEMTGPDGWKVRKDCGAALKVLLEMLNTYLGDVEQGDLKVEMDEAASQLDDLITKRHQSGDYFAPFNEPELAELAEKLKSLCGTHEVDVTGGVAALNPDAPIPFDVSDLPNQLQAVATRQGASAAQFISFLTVRVRSMLADGRLRPVIQPEEDVTLAGWLNDYLGTGSNDEGPIIAVVDLSLVPTEVVHILVAGIGRIAFEALQRHRKECAEELPTVVVLEEAHSFIHVGGRYEWDSARDTCRRTFERIAREGRKFGLGLVLSSQRPSEISQTVLSQCNTFILHRLVNARDQQYVAGLVPDLLSGLLAELPSLPSQHAVVLGWASPIPRLVRIRDLDFEQRPHSDDPRFWEVWTGEEDRQVDWDAIATAWTAGPKQGSDEEDDASAHGAAGSEPDDG